MLSWRPERISRLYGINNWSLTFDSHDQVEAARPILEQLVRDKSAQPLRVAMETLIQPFPGKGITQLWKVK